MDPMEEDNLVGIQQGHTKTIVGNRYQKVKTCFIFLFLFFLILVAIALFRPKTFDYNPFADHEEEQGNEMEVTSGSGGGIDVEESDEDKKNEILTFEHFYQLCKEAREKNYPKNSVDYEMWSANCGWGYNYQNSSSKSKSWNVYLVGNEFTHLVKEYSGCPDTCPHSPKCKIQMARNMKNVKDADVFVVFQTEAGSLHTFPKQNKKKTYKVLYWREAVWKAPNIQVQKLFDFEMGIHYYGGLLNPSFTRTPAQLLSMELYPFPPLEFLPLNKRENFAISIISHCHASSQRDLFSTQLSKYLNSKNKIHRYGECGDRPLPPKPINNAALLISKYKFYLSFENTIQDGYITEKLFYVLNIPVVPIYYGALNVPNITTTPSFIRASDFKGPKELAKYLEYLDENPDEYNKYHAWRFNKKESAFTKEYLHTLQWEVVGPEEMYEYKQHPHKYKRFPRTAQCCRLCDENFVRVAAEERSQNLKKSLVPAPLSGGEIARYFFGGKM